MSSYITNNLIKNEKIITQANVSWWSQMALIVFGLLLLPIGIGVIPLVLVFLRVWTTELAITNHKVIAKTGFIRRNTIELRLSKVEGLSVDQGVLGRIFNFGTINITGTGGIKTPIPYIKNPVEFRRVLNEFLEDPAQFD